MKKLFCLLIAWTLVIPAGIALAKGPQDPHKGDVGGVLSKKIEEAIRQGKDPSTIVNVPGPTPTDPPYSYAYDYGKSANKSNTYFSFIDVPTPTGMSPEVYQLFRAHALKWFDHSTSLQSQFGNFTAYFAYAVSAETGNYYQYHATRMTFDAYLKTVVYTNKMPYKS